MRLDPVHSKKLARAITRSPEGRQEVKLDIDFMQEAMARLTLWEQGLLTKAIMRAVRSRRRTPEQRSLLALFVDQGGRND